MIITITGKPCSGKSAVIEYLINKYKFEKFSGGAIFRRIAAERGVDVLELNRLNDTSVDKLVDDEIVKLGKENLEKDIIFDSRTAWHFIPDSFKVFVDVNPDEQARRLFNSGRDTKETGSTLEEAKVALEERWYLENTRYYEIYGFDNTNPAVFDLVVDNSNLTIEETGEIIYKAYLKYVEKRKEKA